MQSAVLARAVPSVCLSVSIEFVLSIEHAVKHLCANVRRSLILYILIAVI